MNTCNMEVIVESVIKELKNKLFVMVEASGRHIHLSDTDLYALFGNGYKLTPIKDLSQPGQYACAERVTVTGPKGSLQNVVILGPTRPSTQLEISLTDGLTLGIKPPVRLSGDIDNTPGITITNPKNGVSITIDKGVIVAKRHIHITPVDAQRFGVSNGQTIKVKVFGDRTVIFEDLDVRVSEKYKTAVHIDYDEANACGYTKKSMGLILS